METEKTKRPRSVLQQEQLTKARARALQVRKERADLKEKPLKPEPEIEKPLEPKPEIEKPHVPEKPPEPEIEKPVEPEIEKSPEPKVEKLPSPPSPPPLVEEQVPEEEVRSLRFHNGTLMFYE